MQREIHLYAQEKVQAKDEPEVHNGMTRMRGRDDDNGENNGEQSEGTKGGLHV